MKLNEEIMCYHSVVTSLVNFYNVYNPVRYYQQGASIENIKKKYFHWLVNGSNFLFFVYVVS